MFNLESFYQICSTAYGKTVYSTLVGAVGTVILVAFFNMVVMPADSIKFLPVIIAFNAALTGYMVLEKTRSFFQHKWMVAIISGLAATLLAFFALNTFFMHIAGLFLINLTQLLIMLAIGTGASWFGGILAINHLDLN
ncbi:MAG: hypothetical protein GY697_10830 [Desulfobacterales bacterium]|nr:hypothetical protein [Desulfobacterales bacterium]